MGKFTTVALTRPSIHDTSAWTIDWDFLTGEPEEIGQVVRAMKVFTTNDRGIGHSDLMLFVNARGEEAFQRLRPRAPPRDVR